MRLPDFSGVELLRRLRASGFSPPAIFLVGEMEDSDALEAVRLGARGIVFKDQAPEELILAIRRVEGGGRWISRDLLDRALDSALSAERVQKKDRTELTPREVEVCRLVGLGYSNKRISKEMAVTEGTVKVHLNNIFRKLEVTSRLQVALIGRGQYQGKNIPHDESPTTKDI
jgi:DNA-binding NarL/FixJ family response regulator